MWRPTSGCRSRHAHGLGSELNRAALKRRSRPRCVIERERLQKAKNLARESLMAASKAYVGLGLRSGTGPPVERSYPEASMMAPSKSRCSRAFSRWRSSPHRAWRDVPPVLPDVRRSIDLRKRIDLDESRILNEGGIIGDDGGRFKNHD